MQPLAAGGPARARRRWSTRASSSGPTARGSRRRCTTSCIYELHVGTFSAEGTFDAAIEHLPGLRELGVTAIEVMPIAEFPGRHGWGYDGVYLSAAHSAYGGPHGFARLVDGAHAAGLAVILDVVHNHVGASGVQALTAFGPYFTSAHETPWGEALNVDREDSDAVREWVLQSAEAWVRDFHVDGLRLDAIHAIVDSSPEHLVAAIARRVHEANARAVVIAESGLNDPRVVRVPALGGWGCDAVWADDFHHALRVAADRGARRLLRGVRRGGGPRQGAAPAARARRRATRRFAGAASARPPTTCRPSASSSSRPTTTRSATARSATACRSRRGRSPRW